MITDESIHTLEEADVSTDDDPFGRSREELAYLDKADFDWKLDMEDRIRGLTMTDDAKQAYDWLGSLASGKGVAS